MKVEIETNGTVGNLTIEGETELERYAISQWFKGLNTNESTMMVRTIEKNTSDWRKVTTTLPD